MNSRSFRIWPLAFGVALIPGTRFALGQTSQRIEEPRWLTLRVSEVSSGAYAEGHHEQTDYRNSGASTKYSRIFVGPGIGMVLDGSVYHPNLAVFHMNTDGAYGWARSDSDDDSEEQYEYLGRFSGTVDLFSNKPLRGTIFGDYDHSYRDYDFFSRLIVDSWRYGGRMRYEQGPWNITTSYTHIQEETQGKSFYYTNTVPVIIDGVDTGLTTDEVRREDGLTVMEDDTISTDVRHERARGATTGNYTFTQYTRQDIGGDGTGEDHIFGIGDTESFGSQNQHNLLTTASYSHRENDIEPTDEYIARANLDLEHRPNLDSIYDFTFDRFEADEYTSDNYNLNSQLRHQFYDSLTSTFILEGADNEVSDSGGDGYTRRVGAGFSEAYTKRLGMNHRLRLSNTLMLNHVDTQWSGDSMSVANESHTFGVGAPPNSFFLNQSLVIRNTIEVWNVGRTERYVENVHYLVRAEGSSTRIERTGLVPMDDTVVVDYEAEGTPSGSYDTINETFTARLDLWNNLWGIYGRITSYTSNAREELRVQDVFGYAVGTDVTWRWLRSGVEHEYYDSTFSEYRSTRFFQGVSFDIDYTSVFSFDLTEMFTEYLDSDRDEETYSAIARYRNRLTSNLAFTLEGGVSLRRGDGVEHELATVRPSLDYAIGKTTVRLEYDYEHELYLENEERDRHLILLRWKRIF